MSPCWRHCATGVAFKVSEVQVKPMCLFLLLHLTNQGASPSPTKPCLLVHRHSSCHDDNGRNLLNVNQPQLNVLYYKSCHSQVSLHSNGTLMKTCGLCIHSYSSVHDTMNLSKNNFLSLCISLVQLGVEYF